MNRWLVILTVAAVGPWCASGHGQFLLPSFWRSSAVSGPSPNDCSPTPWGIMKNGQSVIAYDASEAPGASCAPHSQTRTCENGKLTGTFTYQDCKALKTKAQ